MAGPLAGLTVVEISHQACAWAGKLFGDLGASTVVVEPPGGSEQRTYGPWLDDQPGPERSLGWWYYNTGKRSVVLDLDDPAQRPGFARLIGTADILIEAEEPGRLARLGIDHRDLAAINPRLIHASITPYGRNCPSRDLPVTDLTVLAAGGPVWSCGYDDHSLPPVRGGGNQASHIASHWAVQAVLVALFERDATGEGQFIDVSMHAAANVTTEVATYGYLAAGMEVERQTGRHASSQPTMPTQLRCADGRYLCTGILPRTQREFAAILEWIDEKGWRDEFPLAALLEMGANMESFDLRNLDREPLLAEILAAAREAYGFLCSRLSAYDAFIGWQQRGLAAGIVYSPDEAIVDPHVVARGYPVTVEHPELGRSFTYPGIPYHFSATPGAVAGRAPLVGEHQELVADLGRSEAEA
jgi:crotonobetainyl-CoA:carnitine CoA-transferase CaiB-like acyl-CoA transferase